MNKYLRVSAVAELVGVSRATIWRWVKSGRLPKPLKISSRTTVFREQDVREAIEKLGEALQ